jgi:hypothetical protein
MKRTKLFCLVVTAVVVAVSVVSCASVPPESASPSASIRLVDQNGMRALWGRSFTVNPYLEPQAAFFPSKYEFEIVSFTVSLPSATKVVLSASVYDAEGKESVLAYDLHDFKVFWNSWGTTDLNIANRQRTIDLTYAPASSFTAPRGNRTYYLVMIGKRPIARPATVRAWITLDGEEADTQEYALPDLPPAPPKK